MINTELITKPISDVTFAVVDTETTGMNARFSRVMDIGIVFMKNGEVIKEWSALIDPKQSVPYWITKYTKLTLKDVKGKPTFEFYAPEIERLLTGCVFVAHNASFDYSFLSFEMQRVGLNFLYPKLCTVMLSRKLLPHLPNAHLDALSDYYNIKISQRHRALPDAQATAFVLSKLIDIAKEKYYIKTYFDLEKLQNIKVERHNFFRPFDYLFTN